MTSDLKPASTLPVAVIGGGPVGLAAAAHLVARAQPFVVLEAGPEAGHTVRRWGHVRLFSPWRYCVDAEAGRLLAQTAWTAPDPDELPTGNELIDRYVAPLAAHPAIAPNLRFDARVVSISRSDVDKVRTARRAVSPFEIELEDGSRLYARAVIDSTGTWTTPNPMGANGRPARGEQEYAGNIQYGIPDILGGERSRYAGRRVLVVGSGHSAINNVLDLLTLRQSDPATTVLWAMRREQVESVYGGESLDALPARGALGQRARHAVESGALEVLTPFRIERVGRQAGRLEVSGLLGGLPHGVTVDEVVVATGFRPELDMLRELRLDLDPALESTRALGPLIDPNLHSCGTVPPHGYRELAHPEPGFFVIGAKSYGRAPTFLMATGFEQARSVVAHLAGDEEAALRVELVLPETGVCSAPGDDSSACCATPAPSARFGAGIDFIPLAEVSASACCGGPATADVNACCALDETAKASGGVGCGCDGAPARSEDARAGV